MEGLVCIGIAGVVGVAVLIALLAFSDTRPQTSTPSLDDAPNLSGTGNREVNIAIAGDLLDLPDWPVDFF